MNANFVELGPSDVLTDRPFTDPVDSFQDLAILEDMVERLGQLMMEPDRVPAWPRPFILYLSEPDGRTHRVAISKRTQLLMCDHLTVVGFFGQKRPEADRAPVDQIDEMLIAEFPQHPFLLSYSTLQLGDGNSCNMVLFSKPQGMAHWAMGDTHAKAVELSPAYYDCIRLHNATLAGGLMSGQPLDLLRTKYFAYDCESPWMAVREFQSPMI